MMKRLGRRHCRKQLKKIALKRWNRKTPARAAGICVLSPRLPPFDKRLLEIKRKERIINNES
jgi:hypothetical protein